MVCKFRGDRPKICVGGESMKYRVFIEQDEDGVFVAEVPSLPGCISQGPTRAEATANIREAIALYLDSLAAHNEPVPPRLLKSLSRSVRERFAAGLRA